MTLDSNLLTIVAIAVGVLGVIATLVAPRLTREARVHGKIFSVDRIRRTTEFGDLRIEIHHGADLIEGSIFIVRGMIQNVGGKDIVSSHFVDPICISANSETDILSLEVSPPAGVNVVVEEISGGWGVRWKILKIRERINFLAVVKAATEEMTTRSVRKSIRIDARLRDVKLGYGALSPDIKFGLTLAVIIFTISMVPIYYFGVRSIDAFVYTNSQGSLLSLYPADGEYKECAIKPEHIYLSECRKIRTDEVAELLSSIQVDRVRVGMSRLAILVAAMVSASYGLIFAYASRDALGIFRSAMMAPRLDRDF